MRKEKAGRSSKSARSIVHSKDIRPVADPNKGHGGASSGDGHSSNHPKGPRRTESPKSKPMPRKAFANKSAPKKFPAGRRKQETTAAGKGDTGPVEVYLVTGSNESGTDFSEPEVLSDDPQERPIFDAPTRLYLSTPDQTASGTGGSHSSSPQVTMEDVDARIRMSMEKTLGKVDDRLQDVNFNLAKQVEFLSGRLERCEQALRVRRTQDSVESTNKEKKGQSR